MLTINEIKEIKEWYYKKKTYKEIPPIVDYYMGLLIAEIEERQNLNMSNLKNAFPPTKPKYKIGEAYKIFTNYKGRVKDGLIRDIYKNGNGYVYKIESTMATVENEDIIQIEYIREDEILVRYSEI